LRLRGQRRGLDWRFWHALHRRIGGSDPQRPCARRRARGRDHPGHGLLHRVSGCWRPLTRHLREHGLSKLQHTRPWTCHSIPRADLHRRASAACKHRRASLRVLCNYWCGSHVIDWEHCSHRSDWAPAGRQLGNSGNARVPT